MIKCITFDLDDTLWKIEPVITRAEVEFQKWLEKNYPIVAEQFSIEKLRDLAKQTSLENSKIKHDLSKVRMLAYEHIRSLFSLPANMPEDAFNYFMKYRNTVQLFDGVKEILEILSNDYLLGTITNGNASLEKIGIKKFFDFETKAADVGFMKPSKEIFQKAIKKANCKPSEIVHVGDSYEKDIIGAMSVNMNYIWLNHSNKNKDDIKIEQTIKSFSEISQVLKKLR